MGRSKEVCKACGGWTGRAEGTPPICVDERCPGATCTREQGGWIRVERKKGGGLVTRRVEGPEKGTGGVGRAVLKPSRDYGQEEERQGEGGERTPVGAE